MPGASANAAAWRSRQTTDGGEVMTMIAFMTSKSFLLIDVAVITS